MSTLVKLKVGTYPHKWIAEVTTKGVTRTVRFGHRDYQDYTMHRDPERMRRYLGRHQAREDWTKSGIFTAGFWSRWLLWSQPSFEDAKKEIARRFNVNFTK